MRLSLSPPCLIGVIFCLLVSGLTGWLSAEHVNGWYQTLHQPDFNPPSWVFAPVWTVLYVMIGITAGLLWIDRKKFPLLFSLFILQLMFNFSWSFIFFIAENISWALMDILALWLCLLVVVLRAFYIKKVVAWLLLPYLFWTSFAAILNFYLWQLN